MFPNCIDRFGRQKEKRNNATKQQQQQQQQQKKKQEKNKLGTTVPSMNHYPRNG